MTWTQQLLHVLRRDLRHFRWYVAAYAITVALLVARVYRTEESIGFNVSLLLILVGLGMFLVAIAIQADPPTAEDAMWRATPLAPSALFAAKLALVVLLLLLGLAGQFVALSAFALGAGEIAVYLLQSIVPMCWWLVGSMLIAAHTRDARWYITVLVITPIAFAILLWFGSFGFISSFEFMFGMPYLAEGANDPAALLASLQVVALVAALLLLALAYTRRVGRRTSTVAAVLMLIVGGFIGAADTMVSGARTPGEKRLLAPDVRVQASMAIDVSDQENSTVSLRLTAADVAPADRLLLESPVLGLLFPDGSRVRLPLRTGLHASLEETPDDQTRFEPAWQAVVFAEPAQVAATGATWPTPRFREHRFTIPSTFTNSQRLAIDSGRVEAWVEADAQLLQARVIAEVPSIPGAQSTVPGLRLSVAEYRREYRLESRRGQRVDRVVHLSTLPRKGDLRNDPGGGSLLAILLGREPQVLSQRMFLLGDDLVLPGVSRSNTSFSLVPERWRMRTRGGRPVATRDSVPGWLDSARVVVLRWENPRAARLTSDPVRLVSATIPAVRGDGSSARAAVSVPLND
jgi:hypothetical protein